MSKLLERDFPKGVEDLKMQVEMFDLETSKRNKKSNELKLGCTR